MYIIMVLAEKVEFMDLNFRVFPAIYAFQSDLYAYQNKSNFQIVIEQTFSLYNVAITFI